MTDFEVKILIQDTLKLKPGLTLQQLAVELGNLISGRQSSGVGIAQDLVEVGNLEIDNQFGLHNAKIKNKE